MMKNYATSEATQAMSQHYQSLMYQPLGSTGLYVSQAGFGSYRVQLDEPVHEEALMFALEMGINLIDTSTNYGDGDSETLIGDVLRNASAQGTISREQVVIVSKAGYIQGQNWMQYQSRKNTEKAWPDVVELDRGLAHCMHPDFLRDQLNQSLSRLKLDTLDVLLIHNPEYFLSYAHANGQELESARSQFYARLKQAFEYLESEVSQGRIQAYGVSSNTFPYPSSSHEFVSLSKVMDVAASVQSDHHCRVIQFPLNVIETGGMSRENQPDGQTVMDLAQHHELGVLINRPLNAIRVVRSDYTEQVKAIQTQQLIRLSDYHVDEPVEEHEIMDALAEVLEEEERYRFELASKVRVSDEQAEKALSQIFYIGHTLAQTWQQFTSFAHWNEMLSGFVLSNMELGATVLSYEDQSVDITQWFEQYLQSVNHFASLVSGYYRERSAEESHVIKERLLGVDEEWASAERLSQMAIRALRTTQGVSSVLVGMRKLEYVEDVLSELAQPIPVQDRKASWEALAAMELAS